jgi:hypothetical protein
MLHSGLRVNIKENKKFKLEVFELFKYMRAWEISKGKLKLDRKSFRRGNLTKGETKFIKQLMKRCTIKIRTAHNVLQEFITSQVHIAMYLGFTSSQDDVTKF